MLRTANRGFLPMTEFRLLAILFTLLGLSACQATSTAYPYTPANCGMVGSSCDIESSR